MTVLPLQRPACMEAPALHAVRTAQPSCSHGLARWPAEREATNAIINPGGWMKRASLCPPRSAGRIRHQFRKGGTREVGKGAGHYSTRASAGRPGLRLIVGPIDLVGARPLMLLARPMAILSRLVLVPVLSLCLSPADCAQGPGWLAAPRRSRL